MALTTAEVKVLRNLAPSYRAAIQKNEVEMFFEQAFMVWFTHFPEPQNLMDAEEHAYKISCCKKVGSFSVNSWSC